jgi:hypothetical protein
VSVAAAQTVIVRNAAPGSAVEVVLNAATASTGAADAAGVATLPAKMKETIGKTEIDANVFVDTCENKRRVVIVEVGASPIQPGVGCERRQISGLYWVRPVNTVVVNLAGITPTLLLIKGSYGVPAPGADGTEASESTHNWRLAPSGLVVSGGGGLSQYRDALTLACGNVQPCSGHASGLAYTGAVTYWINRFIGVEGAYIKPKNMTASGGDTFKFKSTLDADVWTLGGLIGGPIGPVRLYGKAGVNYHQATSTTTETISGASQTFAYRTKGLGWLAGVAGEGWVTPRVAIFVEGGLARLKGDAEGGGEALIDDHLRLLVAGIKLHIGR